MVNSFPITSSNLKKKNTGTAYNLVWEEVAAGMTILLHTNVKYNPVNIPTKALGTQYNYPLTKHFLVQIYFIIEGFSK